MKNDLEKLTEKIQTFGKEDLSDILYYTATSLKSIFECHIVRVYLEDLHQGILICQYMTEQKRPVEQQITKFISPRDSMTSQAFYENRVIRSWNLPEGFIKYRNPFEKMLGVQASVVFPIVHELRPIGTLTLDWEKEGNPISNEKIDAINSFLTNISVVIDRAKRFHQQISFSRHLDLARKKEAAWMIVRSAVKLIDKVALASVFIPASSKFSNLNQATPTDLVEIIAVYSKNKEDLPKYLDKEMLSVLNDENLINRIVKYSKKNGLVARKNNQSSIYIKNIWEENFTRKEVIKKLDMMSLYQVPKYDYQSGKFICSVNYYTNKIHQFSPIEIRLLEEHAAMVEKSISGDSSEHIEIEILGEIEGLLASKHESLPIFLHKILNKTSELIGADSGSISISKIIDGKPWLVVENTDGSLLGAKSRGWTKNKIPAMPVGGDDIPDSLKSLNGYCAHTAQPIILTNVQDAVLTKGFYKNLSPSISSEMAVPIIFGNSVIGVINQDHFRKNYFTVEHKRIVQIISSLISQKVNNLIQIQELKQEITQLRQEVEYRDPKVSSYYFGNVIGRSKTIHQLVNRINTVVESVCNRMLKWDTTSQASEANMGLPSLLIHGETGTGKEFFFNNIYSRITEIFKQKNGENFKLILRKTNIAAYSGELTYSELFGHKKGAYTGAEFSRQGILEEANGGVVFLDEIGDADPKTQVQLLRFLDTGVFMRLGENQPRYSRIFLIAATNKNLRKEIDEGRFREDLYHRLNALNFRIPTLNERQEDISDLATHFLGILFQAYKKGHTDEAFPRIETSAVDYLINHTYRGNVRELKNILMRALMFRQGSLITLEDIIEACQSECPSIVDTPKQTVDPIDSILNQLEVGEGDFWSQVHKPFKKNIITKGTVKDLIQTARNRYQANLPGLAVKLGACTRHYQSNSEELKKFTSFKNFLYKTVKISEPN